MARIHFEYITGRTSPRSNEQDFEMSSCFFPSTSRMLKAATLLIACAVFVSCGASESKRRLAFKVHPQDSFMLFFTGTQSLTLHSDSAEARPMQADIKLVYEFGVESIAKDGNIWFNIKVKQAKMPWFQASLGKALKGKSFLLQMTPDGQVVDFLGTDKMRQQVFGALDIPYEFLSSIGETDAIGQLAASLMEEISDDSLRAKFETVFRIWPDIPVSPGDSWQRDDIVIPSDSVNDSTIFMVDSWKDGIATISTVTTLTPNNLDPAKNLEGSVYGELKIKTMTGFPVKFSYTKKLEGSVRQSNQRDIGLTIIDDITVEFLRL